MASQRRSIDTKFSSSKYSFPRRAWERGFTNYLVRLGIFKLSIVQLSIEAFLGKQFLMAALFNNISLIHHQDHIRIADRRQAVGDDKAGSVLHQSLHRAAE